MLNYQTQTNNDTPKSLLLKFPDKYNKTVLGLKSYDY